VYAFIPSICIGRGEGEEDRTFARVERGTVFFQREGKKKGGKREGKGKDLINHSRVFR